MGDLFWLRRMESNQRPSGYEPDELPLLYSAKASANLHFFFDICKFLSKKMQKKCKKFANFIYFLYICTLFCELTSKNIIK